MAVTIFDMSAGETPWWTAAAVLARATLGMLALGMLGFGRRAAINRATGRLARR